MIKTWLKSPAAVLPTKAHPDDVGYDLTIIKEEKRISDDCIMYDTAVCVTPPAGHYIEVFPRSSIYKTGWMIANSAGIIDPSYTGTIKIVMNRVRKDVPDLPLPFKGFQMVLRQNIPSQIELTEEPQNETLRGEGGFGSTN